MPTATPHIDTLKSHLLTSMIANPHTQSPSLARAITKYLHTPSTRLSGTKKEQFISFLEYIALKSLRTSALIPPLTVPNVASKPRYKLTHHPTKGRCLVATSLTVAGTTILVEAPLFTVASSPSTSPNETQHEHQNRERHPMLLTSLAHALQKLTLPELARFRELGTGEGPSARNGKQNGMGMRAQMEEDWKRFVRNNFDVVVDWDVDDDDDGKGGERKMEKRIVHGIFPQVSMMNHACLPNADWEWVAEGKEEGKGKENRKQKQRRDRNETEKFGRGDVELEVVAASKRVVETETWGKEEEWFEHVMLGRDGGRCGVGSDGEPSGKMVVRAIRDIRAGEEICVAYEMFPSRERLRMLWGFECGCGDCVDA